MGLAQHFLLPDGRVALLSNCAIMLVSAPSFAALHSRAETGEPHDPTGGADISFQGSPLCPPSTCTSVEPSCKCWSLSAVQRLTLDPQAMYDHLTARDG